MAIMSPIYLDLSISTLIEMINCKTEIKELIYISFEIPLIYNTICFRNTCSHFDKWGSSV